MLIFYIVCGCLLFVVSGVAIHINRGAIYRRRIIRHFAAMPQYTPPASPFVLTDNQEKQIKDSFSQAIPIQECIDKLEKQIH